MARVAILGAGGLIGHEIARRLYDDGFDILAVARRFSRAQCADFPRQYIRLPIVDLDCEDLAQLFRDHDIDIVVNCVGLLQDVSREKMDHVHDRLVENLLQACGPNRLLAQISIPDDGCGRTSDFAETKRNADIRITNSLTPYAILRPGFVIAPGAYGASALLRTLGAFGLAPPDKDAGRPFRFVDIDDVASTISWLVAQWRIGERGQKFDWDVMSSEPTSFGDVYDAFAMRTGPKKRRKCPAWLVGVGADMGDFAGILGWRPPLRKTSLAEIRRGVMGDPTRWMAQTGIVPKPLSMVARHIRADVQETWFARLYLFKAAILVYLSLYWISNGMAGLLLELSGGRIMTPFNIDRWYARFFSDADMSEIFAAIALAGSALSAAIGVAIAFRRTSEMALKIALFISILNWVSNAGFLSSLNFVDPSGDSLKGVARGLALLFASIFGGYTLVIPLILAALALKRDR